MKYRIVPKRNSFYSSIVVEQKTWYGWKCQIIKEEER